MASATLGSPIAACHAVGGSWLAMSVDRRSLRSSMTSRRSRRSASVCGARRDRYGEHFFCRLPDDTICLLPAWMFDSANRKSAIGPPVIAIEALAALRDLLTTVRAAGASGSSLRSAPEDRDEATAST